ncbi:hypothetical protein [Paenarthrobacter sp. YJN-5]|uniref:hypothetical protein n=1 Tax=Paenarthrobacter sp. YJN-5 TaxID=2735316 RepID=UPI001878F443|nr:hypothetical protein [Paenarthrobacter sp. YJN-5]QOT19490.1 hypothetical protein HMI59_22905 [Paenarthrobacter sp. YJN-5]
MTSNETATSPEPTAPRVSEAAPVPVVRAGAPRWVRALHPLARKLDSLPFSPSQLASRADDALWERRQAAGARNAEWAAIEERRTTGGSAKVLLDDHLNWGHFERQREIETELVPDPWWLPVAARAERAKLSDLTAVLVETVDRVRRGWVAADAYNLGTSLPRHVGEQLAWLADNACGWPAGSKYATFEDWTGELRRHAVVLTTGGYGDPNEADRLLDVWHDARMASDRTGEVGDEVRTDLAWKEMQDAEAAAEAAVKSSLRWVADNLGALWD